MLRTLRFAFLVAVAATVVFSAASAIAAPATWQSVDVTLHAEQSGGIMLVSGELPPATKLPAQAELSVPAGSKIQWIGELLGGPASEDPEVPYTKVNKGGVDVYQFTLTKSRAAQVEIPTAEALGFDGTTYNPSLKWTSAQDIPEVRISVRVPQGATIVQEVPGATLQPGPEGSSVYTKTVKDVKAGAEQALAFSYSAPAGAASASATALGGASTASSPSSWVVPMIIIVAAGVAGIALAVSVRRKLAAKATKDDARSARSGSVKTRTSANGGRPKASGATSASSAASRPEPVAEKPGLSGTAKRNLVTVGIIGVLVVTAVVLGSQATKPKATGQTITKKFSQAEPCANVVVALALPSDADSNATANRLFEALQVVKGLNTVTYNGAASNIDVGFCESQTNEAAVREALAPTGLVDASAPVTATP